MNQHHIQKSIDEASGVLGKTWPLYSFVTSNPLSGYEKLPFKEAVGRARALLNVRIYPEASLYRQAWEHGEIDEKTLLPLLREKGLFEFPEFYLQEMESQKKTVLKNPNHDLDRIMAKWLSAYMDEGLAEWEMPNKKEGFYNAWRSLAPYDGEMGVTSPNEIPQTSLEALVQALTGFSHQEYTNIFTYHLAALPGWAGYINYRKESNSTWQQKFPISLEDYLGVRLWIARKIKARIVPADDSAHYDPGIEGLQYIWLKAWERSWQNQLIKSLEKESLTTTACQDRELSPDAQLVFCIDTRSEPIRRHVESKGNYQTFGYAGFFGIAMDYEDPNDGLRRKSCPPIVSSAYAVSEIPQANKAEHQMAFRRQIEIFKFGEYFLKRMKNMLPSAFGYVEGSGFFYGLSLLGRTILPGYFYRLKQKSSASYEHAFEPEIKAANPLEKNTFGLSLDEKVAIVKTAFDLTGWNGFAPLVLFVGHGSHSANNPFGSSLDCGACAASRGRHNARMLAKLANMAEVRKALARKHALYIPKDTVFLGAEHNTTTDEIVIFDSDLPGSHRGRLQDLKSDLLKAQQTATRERLGIEKNSIALTHHKANNWGETRPEWGLAKNAGFIIAPRSLTRHMNLHSRCFLHSYDCEKDPTGQVLESIMQGPMVVTQWINNHYYFSTVDNDGFGGGSKITHNITGKFGVVRGNGGDLKRGLPLQSLFKSDDDMYHRPLRLSVLIQAPLLRVSLILSRNENLKRLLDNEWIYLLVMDPLQHHAIKRYQRNLEWIPATEKSLAQKISDLNTHVTILDEILT